MAPREVSREELFRQVWTTPIVQLAVFYGISDRGLAKICDRLDVPYPTRGYWAKKAAGTRVRDRKLRINRDVPSSVVIRPTAPPPELRPLSLKAASRLALLDGAFSQAKRDSDPHPIVAGWRAERAQQRAEERLAPTRYPAPAWTVFEERAHHIFDVLFRAVEQIGMTVELGAKGAPFLRCEGERIAFLLRPLQIQLQRGMYRSTPVLAFTIQTLATTGVRSQWADGITRPLEARLPEIVRAVARVGIELGERRRDKAARDASAERARLERQIDADRRREDQAQWDTLLAAAWRWQEIELARRFIHKVESRDGDALSAIDERPVAEWLAWARHQVALRGHFNAEKPKGSLRFRPVDLP